MFLYSTEFLTSKTEPYLVYITEEKWIRYMDALKARRIFAALTFPDGTVHYSPVSAQMKDDGGDNGDESIYAPLWMIPSGFEMGSEISVEFLPEEAFPEALRIVLRPLDSAFYNTNAEEELTRALSSIGVLKKHSTISVKLSELGGFPMEFFVVELEPAELVLCNGDEVAIEFEEAVDQWDGRRPPTPPPAPPEALVPMAEALVPMVPLEESNAARTPPPPGRVLGGGTTRRMPDGRPWNPYRQVERNV